jgi:hypothetical protein
MMTKNGREKNFSNDRNVYRLPSNEECYYLLNKILR